ncbi:MAG: hypothetical protein R6U70_08080 [Bacillota bacterium]
MFKEKLAAVVFEGGIARTEIEEQMLSVRKGVAFDNMKKALTADGIDEVILSTCYADLAEKAAAEGIRIDETAPDGEFHFGRHLKYVTEKYGLDSVIYLGGAALPLIRPSDFEWIAHQLRYFKNVVVVNNVQSADLIAFTPATSLDCIDLPENDNFLGFLLREAGMRRMLIENSARINFDIDTPMDMLILEQCRNVGPESRRALDRLNLSRDNLIRALDVIRESGRDRYAEVALIGRVSPAMMAVINANIPVRLRVFSEERGMKALRREETGEAVSLLGYFLEAVGPERFFRHLSSVADVALVDTRVLMAHLQLALSAADRFYSDLGMMERITDSYLREFTEAAYSAPLPVVLGGHSLVYGGLWAILDEWGLLEHDLPHLPT